MIIGISGKKQSGKDTIGKIIQYLSVDWDGLCTNYRGLIKHSFEVFAKYPWNKYSISDWEIKKFATKLKQILSILTGIPVEDIEKEEVKNSYLGKEWNRHHCKTNIDECWDSRPFSLNTGEKNSQGKIIFKESFLQGITVRQALQWIGTDLFRDKFHPQTWCNALMCEYEGEHPDETVYPNWIITDVRFPNEAQAVKDRGGIIIRVNRPLGYNKFFGTDGKTTEHESETALDNYDKFDYIINNDGTIEDLIKKVKEILIKEKII